MARHKILIVGTHGVPAKYGGFETLTAQLLPHLEDYGVGVVCSNRMTGGPRHFQGARLHYMPLSASGYQSVAYDVLSMFVAVSHSYDLVLYLGPSMGAATLIPKIFGRRIVVNLGGLDEWSRPKYSWIVRKLIWLNYWVATKVSDLIIADNSVIGLSVAKNFGKDTSIIRYGGDHVREFLIKKLPYALPATYALVVARAQADTLLEEIIDAWPSGVLPLVIVSNWSVSSYGVRVKEKGAKKNNVHVLDAIYDSDELNTIRAKCEMYIHTHTLCGTAPSLVEAINLELPIFSVDVATNRETTNERVHYWSDADELVRFIQSDQCSEDYLDSLRAVSKGLRRNYEWSTIATKYKEVFQALL